jgi:hypothetical protein
MNSLLSRKMNSLKRLHDEGSGLKATQASLPSVSAQPSLLRVVFMKTLRMKWRRYDCSITDVIVQPSVSSNTHSEENQLSDAGWILPVKCK